MALRHHCRRTTDTWWGLSRPTATPPPEPSGDTSPDAVEVSGSRTDGLQAVLALPDFRRLWLGQIFSQLADKF